MIRSAWLGHLAIVLGMSVSVCACGDSSSAPTPVVPADFTGLYDVKITAPNGELDTTVVGTAGGSGDVLGFAFFPPGVISVSVRGTLERDGSVRVTEAGVIESDFGIRVNADAHARR